MVKRTMAAALMMVAAHSASASDIALDIRQNAVDAENGGFFEVGLGYEYDSGVLADVSGQADQSSSLVFELGGAYFYKGFFVEGAMETYDGLNLGYQLVSNKDWSVDFLASSLSGAFLFGDDDKYANADEELLERDSGYNGAGIRVTRYLGDNIIQGRLVTDVHKGNGIRASVRLGRNWQIRNWNMHGIASYDYASAETMRFLVGITDEEATERFSAYHPDAGSSVSMELGGAYPLSEHVVWKTKLMVTQYSDDVADSPLFVDETEVFASTTLNYVF